MGGLSIWHLIFLPLILAVPLGIVAVIIWLISRLFRRKDKKPDQ